MPEVLRQSCKDTAPTVATMSPLSFRCARSLTPPRLGSAPARQEASPEVASGGQSLVGDANVDDHPVPDSDDPSALPTGQEVPGTRADPEAGSKMVPVFKR